MADKDEEIARLKARVAQLEGTGACCSGSHLSRARLSPPGAASHCQPRLRAPPREAAILARPSPPAFACMR